MCGGFEPSAYLHFTIGMRSSDVAGRCDMLTGCRHDRTLPASLRYSPGLPGSETGKIEIIEKGIP